MKVDARNWGEPLDGVTGPLDAIWNLLSYFCCQLFCTIVSFVCVRYVQPKCVTASKIMSLTLWGPHIEWLTFISASQSLVWSYRRHSNTKCNDNDSMLLLITSRLWCLGKFKPICTEDEAEVAGRNPWLVLLHRVIMRRAWPGKSRTQRTKNCTWQLLAHPQHRVAYREKVGHSFFRVGACVIYF